MINLLTNAIKFSPNDDRVEVNLSYMYVGNSTKNITVKIAVEDFGIGITEEDLKTLFTPYFKTSSEASRA